MALIDDFKARFPEFQSADVDAAWPGLEASWPCYYGTTYGTSSCEDQIILNLIAHLFIVNFNGGSSAAGPAPAMVASSKSVGSVSVTKVVDSNMSDQQSFFNSTRYGQQFNMMTRHRHGACFV